MKEYTIPLMPGDRLFLYTDGIPELHHETDEQYGIRRLQYSQTRQAAYRGRFVSQSCFR